jgi:hypothetical protein
MAASARTIGPGNCSNTFQGFVSIAEGFQMFLALSFLSGAGGTFHTLKQFMQLILPEMIKL